MYSRTIEVTNDVGLHARPAMYFSQVASKYQSHIYIEHDGRRLNGKSLLGILSLGIDKGHVITIIGEGKDEQGAVNKLIELVKNGFREEI